MPADLSFSSRTNQALRWAATNSAAASTDKLREPEIHVKNKKRKYFRSLLYKSARLENQSALTTEDTRSTTLWAGYRTQTAENKQLVASNWQLAKRIRRKHVFKTGKKTIT
jgi:hypothetical protein